MGFEHTWRWFGPKDPLSLKEIRQTGATGIVTALHDVPRGEVWPVDEIRKRKEMVEKENFRWAVAESIPIHESIKIRKGNYRQYIENYKTSIRNLGASGIRTVCYNFMPVLDWSRTDLRVEFGDGSITTKFEAVPFAAFDLFILKREGAEQQYTTEQLDAAQHFFAGMSEKQKETLLETVLLGFPGSGEALTLEGLRMALLEYRDIGQEEFRSNLFEFLKEVIPVAEESGVRMALHPDDPPWSLFGLPRIVSTQDDVGKVLKEVDTISSGITLCTGSFGAGFENDLVAMATEFGPRIHFVHLRNVRRTQDRNFVEDNHLDGDIDMYGVVRALLLEQKRRMAEGRQDRQIPMRPDHGHLMLADRHWKGIYPGYSLFGRMRGLAEIRGLELGIERSMTS